MTEITINRTCAIIDRCEQFTSGRVGARIKFLFSAEWAGLNRTAVFTNGDTTIDVLNVTDECIIPHEVLAISGKKLKVGVYGFTADDDGNIEIAIPTVYAELGKVVKGADPSGDESTEPSLPVWAQIQSDVNNLDDRVTELEQHGGGGGGSSVPKPLTYDYMPEGYPSKMVQTTVLMEEQEVAFTENGGVYKAVLTDVLILVAGQTYTVNWDGTEYECVCSELGQYLFIGNLSILNSGENTGEPFIYTPANKVFATLDNSPSHTISVTTSTETITPMAEEFLPSTFELDTTLSEAGKAADAKAVGDALAGKQDKLIAGENITIAADGKTISATGGGANVELPENIALLEDVTVDEASGDFIPMLSPNGTEYRLSIGDDGIPIIKNISGTTVWSGTSGGSSGGDTGGDDTGGGGTDTTWTSGVPYTLTIIADEYVNKTNGAFEAFAGWSRTDYNPCAGAARITHTGNMYSSDYCAWYDTNKNFISGFSISISPVTTPVEIEVPADAAFFTMSTLSDSMNAMTVTPYET